MKGVSPEAWKKLMILGQKQGSIKLADLSHEMELGPEETLVFLRQVFPMGKGVEIYQHENECWIDISASAIQYMLPLSPSEWIQLHQILTLVNPKDSSPVLTSLKKKVTENGPIKVVMELLSQLEEWDQQLSEHQQMMVNLLDKAILEKYLLKFITRDDKHYLVHPCKVLHLEGQLSVVAEDSQDHCLMIMAVKDIITISYVSTTAVAKVSPFEVDEFIHAIRAMNEKETRLILKIHEPDSINLFPEHQFLGKPCMVTNPNGDLIWAAYVEPCEGLYEWLMSLGRKVEILDPVKFKEEYLYYCEDKLKKTA